MNTITEPKTPDESGALTDTKSAAYEAERETVERLTRGRVQIETELAKVIVGQKEVIEQILITLLAAGIV